MSLFGAGAKALATRQGITVAVILVVSFFLLVMWLFNPGAFDSFVAYLNEHGGFAALFLVTSAILSAIVMWISKKIDPYSVALAFVITVLALVALVVPMTIGA
jgi:hypothetical protein